MYNDRDSSNPSPAPVTSSGVLTIKRADVKPVPTEGSTPAVDAEVKISDLIIDPKLQTRAKAHDGQYIMDLVEVIQMGTLIEPIAVFRDPADGSLRVADGHARVDAAKSAGCATIHARVHEGGLREAFMFALGANATHGVRRTNADLRHAVQTALEDSEMGNWSNVQIAQVCQCSDTFVGIVRKKSAGPSGTPTGARRKGRDGKLYPAKLRRRAAGSNGPTLKGGKSIAGSPPPNMTDALAPTDGEAGSTVSITRGVSTEASQGGQRAEVTTPTRAVHVVNEVVGVMPSDPASALPGDGSHAVAAQYEGEPSTAQTDATEFSDATVVSALEVIPSTTTPAEAMVDPVTQIREFLTASKQVRMALPNLGVPQHLMSEVREEAARLHECLRDHSRPTDARWSAPTTSGDRFRSMMGYNPRPGHASDAAILGVLAAEMDQERLTA